MKVENPESTGDAHRRGPSRTSRAATEGALRFGPHRLYARRRPSCQCPCFKRIADSPVINVARLGNQIPPAIQIRSTTSVEPKAEACRSRQREKDSQS